VFSRAVTDDVSTAASEGPVVVADTVHLTAVNSCPPLPYDAVASIMKALQRPTAEGALRMTAGGVGFAAAVVAITLCFAAGFEKQSSVEQNAFTTPTFMATCCPILRALGRESPVMAAKTTLTVIASCHEHDDESAPGKVNSELHGHDGAVIPP
jgi:hypothetical protein